MATDAELRMVVIDQLLRSSRASEQLRLFLNHSSSICRRPICWNSSASLACPSSSSLVFLPLLNSSLAPSTS
jgi:hypothetical protein